MLSQQQILRTVQIHIKWIRSRCRISGITISIIHIVVCSLCFFCIHCRKCTGPCLCLIYSGSDNGTFSFLYFVQILFIYFSFDPIIPGCKYGHKCLCISTIRIDLIGLVNIFYDSLHLTGDRRITDFFSHLGNLHFFCLFFVFGLFQIHLRSLNFGCIRKFFILGGFFLFFFQLSNLCLQIFHIAVKSFQFQ